MKKIQTYFALKFIAALLAFYSPSDGYAFRHQQEFLRFSAGIAPGIDRVKFSGDGSGTLKMDSDIGYRVDVLGVARFPRDEFDWVMAAGLFVSGHSGDHEFRHAPDSFLIEADLFVFGGLLQAGIARRPTRNLTLELTPEVGVGSARQKLTGLSSGRGPYVMYGIRSGILYNIDGRFEIGVDLGYGGFISFGEIEFDDGSKMDVDFRGHGPRVAGTISYRF